MKKKTLAKKNFDFLIKKEHYLCENKEEICCICAI